MASALRSRTRTLFNRKHRIISSLFNEGWVGSWTSKDNTAFLSQDFTLMINGLKASFSTQSVITNEPPAESLENLQEHEVKYQLPPKNSKDILRAWGCNDQEISIIFKRMPALHKSRLDLLQSKLNILHNLGFSSSDLVKIISCRPRLLSNRINVNFDERIRYLESLFGSREMLQKAIIRNPSFLTYDLEVMIKPTVELYKTLGVTREDLTVMLLSRPTVIPRTSLNSEKLDYIRRTGVSKDSKMYKFVVTLVAISRLETIREKIANLEKFGITEDEVLRLMGSSPFLLTLSADKVQRNMTFVVGIMKLPARTVLRHPGLVFHNLEKVMRPRVLLAEKINEMGLEPRIEGAAIISALRMSDKRFVSVYINSHPEEMAKVLMDHFMDMKSMKRLGSEASKKRSHKGFPF